jgi:hypothetical protein
MLDLWPAEQKITDFVRPPKPTVWSGKPRPEIDAQGAIDAIQIARAATGGPSAAAARAVAWTSPPPHGCGRSR